jgi:SAM-dependent methyltransferase
MRRSNSPETPKAPDRVGGLVIDSFLRASGFHHEAGVVSSRFGRLLLKPYSKLSKRVGRLLFDRRVETYGNKVSVEHFHPERVWYTPSSWSFLRRGLTGFEIDEHDVFVDFGCGKGRVLYQAAHYPFARVVGVEISAELSEAAKENLERNRDKLVCRNFEVITSDVVDFEIPDDLTVAYFYHPFGGETFKSVIDDLVASLDRRPRRVRIVYAIPVMGDYILASGRFKLLKSVRVVHESVFHRLSIFETI